MKDAVPDSRIPWRWKGAPATAFLIGLFSIALLLRADRIRERQQANAALIDAIMDVQIHAATYHIRLEETLSGVASPETREYLFALDKASHLTDVILSGGMAEHEMVSEPLAEPLLRENAAEIRSLLAEMKDIGRERMRNAGQNEIDPALERRFDRVYKDVLRKTRDLEDVLETKEAKNHQQSRRLFLIILLVWTAILVAAAAALVRFERSRKRAEEALLAANRLLQAQAAEVARHREHLQELVDERTAELRRTNEQLRVEIEQRRRTEERLQETGKQIQRLSFNLLDAQEKERKRISTELHDELGQALTVMKLRMRVIERGLGQDQRAVREECAGLLEYIDEIIENVRRIALDLSPTVLEDLGLTAALHWLVDNLPSGPELTVASSVADIDQLLPHEHWISAYRAVQEALTNVVKHAGARTLSLDIHLRDGAVVFSVEDDGRGFDPDGAAVRKTPPRQLGLRTLVERITLIGGVVQVRSREGQGTRITFSLPVAPEGASL
ncbi:MAG TPA: ATP-binding protein [bacterium]